MGLDALLREIHASAEAEVRAIEARAEEAARERLDRAREAAERQRSEARAKAAAPAAEARARLLNQARLDAVEQVAHARQALVDEALAHTREHLAHVREGERYPAVLRRLTEEALDALRPSLRDGEEAHVRANERDQAALAALLRHPEGPGEQGVTVEYGLDCWGGVVASSADGRVVVTNTLDARLERATAYLERALASFFATE